MRAVSLGHLVHKAIHAVLYAARSRGERLMNHSHVWQLNSILANDGVIPHHSCACTGGNLVAEMREGRLTAICNIVQVDKDRLGSTCAIMMLLEDLTLLIPDEHQIFDIVQRHTSHGGYPGCYTKNDLVLHGWIKEAREGRSIWADRLHTDLRFTYVNLVGRDIRIGWSVRILGQLVLSRTVPQWLVQEVCALACRDCRPLPSALREPHDVQCLFLGDEAFPNDHVRVVAEPVPCDWPWTRDLGQVYGLLHADLVLARRGRHGCCRNFHHGRFTQLQLDVN
mmetsp:Transcript_17612/g.31834  ORF Transcript_17612/g.31834 Transcript_17612/m.31834 type:complete len:281 (+) Transcript_17612:92-934(+)